ncbi:PIN domain-containing protein [Nostoc sp. UHCC 0870]|uniref:PIN domain-containing protein n=1 Tax=Nostoc sp. UHCC 0870 TaxID=2914041 RepID=UPI001EDDA6F6|nr:PIN domain-containing protein [Nostoc sp. UHCC 0870]UKP01380.1 PIN domain-containing protein [Nostoc sp. UHCC 0870]
MLVATDLIFEAILNRSGFFPNAPRFFEILKSQQVQGYISSICLEKVCSVVRASVKNSEAYENSEEEVTKQTVSLIKNMRISICEVDSYVIQQARLLNICEAESAVEVACAIANNLEGIITLNPDNFLGSILPIYSEKQFGLEVLLNQPEDKSDSKNTIPEISQPEPTLNKINLKDWLENIFDTDWQFVESILGISHLGFSFRSPNQPHKQIVNRAKKIYLNNRCPMALIFNIVIEDNSNLEVILQLYAIEEQTYLLENTKLIVSDDLEQDILEVQSRNGDIGIKVHFTVEKGDKFCIKVREKDNCFLEYFQMN